MAKNINQQNQGFKKSVVEKLINNYKDFCKGKIKEGSIDPYGSYLNSASKYLEQAKNSFKLPNTNKAFKELPFNADDYLFLIGLFINEGDILYAMTVYDKMYELIKITIDELSKQQRNKNDRCLPSIRNSHSAFFYLQDYIIQYDYKTGPFSKIIKISQDARKKFKKGDLHKLDGMEPMIAHLGIDNFIKTAIESSYFFDPKIVNNLIPKLDTARHTTDQSINIANKPKRAKNVTYVIDGNNYIIEIDKDNNYYVRKLITDNTGITVSSGKGSIIQNTIISHIWGRAYDPRYFTSPWNIVLIPTWANSLMDKEDAKEKTLASKIRATYMAVCSELYKGTFQDNAYWLKLKMGKAPGIKNISDKVKGEYIINILKEKDGKIVNISKKVITLK